MPYERFEQEELILRDELARDRTHLANERTMLAYVRTAVMLLAAGGTAVKLFADSPVAVTAGWGLIALSLPVALLGGWRFAKMRRALRRLDAAGRKP